MKIGVIPENLLERAALMLGLVPTPMGETLPALLLARTLMTAARHGLFAALAPEPRTAAEVAERCGTHPDVTRVLLDTLVSSDHLTVAGDRYALAPVARKWLLPDSPTSLHDSLLYRYLEWDWIARLDDFLETGNPLRIHEEMTREQWDLYQRGMLDFARLSAPELVQRTPVPKGARDLLDIGGSHGYYSAALCRRHPGLRAVVLDLNEAVEHAAALLAREGLGDRVVHRAGDALAEDLGTEDWDVVLLSQLVHHFDEPTNRELIRKIAGALRPGGALVILELIRLQSPKKRGQLGGLLGLYFALTSKSGSWSFQEMAGWQRDAGLVPKKPIRFRLSPGVGMQVGVKQ